MQGRALHLEPPARRSRVGGSNPGAPPWDPAQGPEALGNPPDLERAMSAQRGKDLLIRAGDGAGGFAAVAVK